MPLATSKQLQPECRGCQVSILFEVEVFRLYPWLEQTEVSQLKNVAIDLHQIVRARDVNQFLSGADHGLG